MKCGERTIRKGGKVRLAAIPGSLVAALPQEDRNAISAQLGKVFDVVSVRANGEVELEFSHNSPERGVSFHTIWIAPENLQLVAADG